MALSCIISKPATHTLFFFILALASTNTQAGAPTPPPDHCLDSDFLPVPVGGRARDCICRISFATGQAEFVPRDKSKSYCTCSNSGWVTCPPQPPSSQVTCSTQNLGTFALFSLVGNCVCYSAGTWQPRYAEQQNCSCAMDGADPTGEVICGADTRVCVGPRSYLPTHADGELNDQCKCDASTTNWDVVTAPHPHCFCSSYGVLVCETLCPTNRDPRWVRIGEKNDPKCQCQWDTSPNAQLGLGIWNTYYNGCTCDNVGIATCTGATNSKAGPHRAMAKQLTQSQQEVSNAVSSSGNTAMLQGALIFLGGVCCALAVTIVLLLAVVWKRNNQNINYESQC